jgi:hypothetical protein
MFALASRLSVVEAKARCLGKGLAGIGIYSDPAWGTPNRQAQRFKHGKFPAAARRTSMQRLFPGTGECLRSAAIFHEPGAASDGPFCLPSTAASAAVIAKVRVGGKAFEFPEPERISHVSQPTGGRSVCRPACGGFAPFSAAGCRRKTHPTTCQSAMEAATGSTSASGTWSQRDSFQMLEMAVLRWLAGQSIPHRPSRHFAF